MIDYETRSGALSRAGSPAIDQGLRDHMNSVYRTMSVGMLVTALAAWLVSSAAMTDVTGTRQLTGFGELIYATPLKWLIMFSPLIMVFTFSAAMNRLSTSGATIFFYAFAAVMGTSLSSIFLVFTPFSIVQTFLVTAIAFAGLSLWGYVTKRDISGWGSFLIMGVIGLIVAMIINMFIASAAFNFAITIIGLLIFAGLTAYDTQKIKSIYLQMAESGEEYLGKAAIMGALNLYLDFINMFMLLLNLAGQRE